MEMTQKELDEVLRKHKLWLDGKEGGERADLTWAKLIRADLTGAVLTMANLYNANLTDAKLTDADLAGADLTAVKLTDADLAGADIDYSSLPLWCGSLKANYDDRQLIQIAYHLVKAGLYSKNASAETKTELAKLIDFANKFHRAEECGKIEWREDQ